MSKPRLPKATKLVEVKDTVGKSRKGEEFNICIRVDARTSRQLEAARRNLGLPSRSLLTARVLTEFLDDFEELDVKQDVKEAGKQREKHPDESTAQWQCHVEEVVKRTKMAEQSASGLRRNVLGRAAVARFIRKHPSLCAVDDSTTVPAKLKTKPSNDTKVARTARKRRDD